MKATDAQRSCVDNKGEKDHGDDRVDDYHYSIILLLLLLFLLLLSSSLL